METRLFDYHLPRELIAAAPTARREESRLLVLHRDSGLIEHRVFRDLPEYMRPGDVLTVNDSRVIKARIHGKRLSTGGGVEFLLLERVPIAPDHAGDRWRVMCRPARKLKPGEQVYFANKRLTATVMHYLSEGEREVEFSAPDVLAWLDELGEVPLPPYIVQRRREIAGTTHEALPEADSERYQTVYAHDPGSVAAPTAGLHFSEDLLGRIIGGGAALARVTLHVGPGTFKPVETETVEEHPMHTERFVISEENARIINDAKREHRRVMAVGTTVVRTLESAAKDDGSVSAGTFETKLMILPGFKFKVVDALITNFHLPKSTLLMLVSAFADRETVMHAYETAIAEKYRFYSYGDAMLIL